MSEKFNVFGRFEYDDEHFQVDKENTFKLSDEVLEAISQGGGELEPATADTLGGVKIGEGINVEADGTISASGGSDYYEVLIKVTVTEDEEETTGTAEAIKGDYADCLTAMLAGQYVDAKLIIEDTGNSIDSEPAIIAVNLGGDDALEIYNTHNYVTIIWDADGLAVTIAG